MSRSADSAVLAEAELLPRFSNRRARVSVLVYRDEYGGAKMGINDDATGRGHREQEEAE